MRRRHGFQLLHLVELLCHGVPQRRTFHRLLPRPHPLLGQLFGFGGQLWKKSLSLVPFFQRSWKFSIFLRQWKSLEFCPTGWRRKEPLVEAGVIRSLVIGVFHVIREGDLIHALNEGLPNLFQSWWGLRNIWRSHSCLGMCWWDGFGSILPGG